MSNDALYIIYSFPFDLKLLIYNIFMKLNYYAFRNINDLYVFNLNVLDFPLVLFH